MERRKKDYLLKKEEKMEQFLLDSGVIHAIYNKEDVHHSVCFRFLNEHKDARLYIPTHSRFEIQSSISKRKKAKTFTRHDKNIRVNFKNINIDAKFYQECQDKKLFSLFDCLKGGDLIFACIAKLRGYTLLTCDKDYKKYGTNINIIYLPELGDS